MSSLVLALFVFFCIFVFLYCFALAGKLHFSHWRFPPGLYGVEKECVAEIVCTYVQLSVSKVMQSGRNVRGGSKCEV